MNSEVFNIGKELLSAALDHSAESFAYMTDVQAQIIDTTFERSDLSKINLIGHGQILLLKTELVGTISGINYFILTQNEVKTLCNHCFEHELLEAKAQSMAIEFLKEIENVTAAAAVSIIAERLDTELFGDVPKIHAVEGGLARYTLEHELNKLDADAMLLSKIHIPELGIAPQILWFFGKNLGRQLASVDRKLLKSA